MKIIDQQVGKEPIEIAQGMEAFWRETLAKSFDQLDALDDSVDENAKQEIGDRIRDLREKVTALDRMKAGGVAPANWSVSIEYDAQNAMGVPLRGFAKCSTASWAGPVGEVAKFNLDVEGEQRKCTAIGDKVFC